MIVIYRKDAPGKRPAKLGKAKLAQKAEHLALTSRVSRPSLTEFFMSGEFYRLPALKPQCIDNRAHRIIDHGADGWAIPDDSLGRVADAVLSGDAYANKSAAQSILLWIKKNLDDVVDPAHVSIVVQ